jgi:hypothetical protein
LCGVLFLLCTFLDEPVVLYRAESGSLVALEAG